jgi:hypothetical protein
MITAMPDAGGYQIERELKPATTWLARDATGRPLVLKRLPKDCLRAGKLHPAVRDRLERFRELPLVTFATLIGVERQGDDVITVSEYIDGTPLASIAPDKRHRLLKALRHTIGALHTLGLVHGQLHEGNVVVDHAGTLRVLDPSPLLHDDPNVDLIALDRLDPPAEPAAATVTADEDAPIRRRTLVAAAVLAVAGIIAAVVLGIVGSHL